MFKHRRGVWSRNIQNLFQHSWMVSSKPCPACLTGSMTVSAIHVCICTWNYNQNCPSANSVLFSGVLRSWAQPQNHVAVRSMDPRISSLFPRYFLGGVTFHRSSASSTSLPFIQELHRFRFGKACRPAWQRTLNLILSNFSCKLPSRLPQAACQFSAVSNQTKDEKASATDCSMYLTSTSHAVQQTDSTRQQDATVCNSDLLRSSLMCEDFSGSLWLTFLTAAMPSKGFPRMKQINHAQSKQSERHQTNRN